MLTTLNCQTQSVINHTFQDISIHENSTQPATMSSTSNVLSYGTSIHRVTEHIDNFSEYIQTSNHRQVIDGKT